MFMFYLAQSLLAGVKKAGEDSLSVAVVGPQKSAALMEKSHGYCFKPLALTSYFPVLSA